MVPRIARIGTNSKTLFASVLLGLLLAGGCTLFHEKEIAVSSISVTQTERLLESDTTVALLDVRTLEEWRSETGHLKNALLIPIQDLEAHLSELTPYKNKTIIAYCRSGNRSQRAAKILAARGFRVLNMEGGILRWNAEHLPVVNENGQ